MDNAMPGNRQEPLKISTLLKNPHKHIRILLLKKCFRGFYNLYSSIKGVVLMPDSPVSQK
jgi:hypothetical protein